MAEAKRPRLDSLTGLRAIAAGLVFFNHFGDLFHEHFSWFTLRVLESGRCGVSFFFILSGFVLTWSAREGDTRARFYRRRVARIVPDHVVAWGIAVSLLAWQGAEALGAQSFGSLLFLQAWLPPPDWHFAGNPVAWSLSCEAFFYLLFPALLPAIQGRSRTGRRLLCAALVGLGIGVPLATQLVLGSVHSGTWFFYVFPGVRLIEFALGVVVGCMVVRGELPRLPVLPLYALAVLAFVAMQLGPVSLVPVGAMLVPFTLIIAARAQADAGGSRSLFGGGLWVRLGEWSYAFYLLHELVLRVVGWQVDVSGLDAAGIAVATGVALVGATAASAALYTFVERPFERRLRQGSDGRRRSLPAADDSAPASRDPGAESGRNPGS